MVSTQRDPDPPGTWLPPWKSFARALRAIPRSERTLKSYGEAIRDLARHPEPAPALEKVTREHVEASWQLCTTAKPVLPTSRFTSGASGDSSTGWWRRVTWRSPDEEDARPEGSRPGIGPEVSARGSQFSLILIQFILTRRLTRNT